MAENNEIPHHQLTENDGSIAQNTLQSALSYLAASASASGPGDGSRTGFSASFAALLQWGVEQDLVHEEKEFGFFRRKPFVTASEHSVWFIEPNRWFKVTNPPNTFGIAWGRDGTATPTEYLTRIALQNEHFADDIRLECLLNCGQKMRILTSQRHVEGRASTYEEIQWWFANLGFVRIVYGTSIAWYSMKANLLIADAHEANVIFTSEGKCVPIDLNITKPSGDLREWACDSYVEATGLMSPPSVKPA